MPEWFDLIPQSFWQWIGFLGSWVLLGISLYFFIKSTIKATEFTFGLLGFFLFTMVIGAFWLCSPVYNGESLLARLQQINGYVSTEINAPSEHGNLDKFLISAKADFYPVQNPDGTVSLHVPEMYSEMIEVCVIDSPHTPTRLDAVSGQMIELGTIVEHTLGYQFPDHQALPENVKVYLQERLPGGKYEITGTISIEVKGRL